MRPSSLFFFFAPALLASAQSSSGGGNSSAHVHVSTILSVGQNVDGNHQAHTFTSTILTTITDSPAPTGTTGNNGNQTSPGGNSSASTTTTPRNLPTASPVDGGGGPDGAPQVGKDNSGGIYGPPDDHFSSARHIEPLVYLVSLGGLAVGTLATLL